VNNRAAIKMLPLTNQEWILIVAVIVALVIFIGAVICIIYSVVRALHLDENREETHTVCTVKNSALKAKCTRHNEVKKEQVVLQMESVVVEMDKEPSEPTEVQASFAQIDAQIATSPQSTVSAKTMPSPADEDSSTLEVEFDKKSVTEYQRRLAETECLMNKLRQQLSEKPKPERKVWFNDEPEVFMNGMPPLPEAASSPIMSIPEPNISPIFAPMSFKSARKPLSSQQLPPLKSFTPPRSLTPQNSAPDQATLLMAPKKPKGFAARRTFKRPHSSIDKPVVHQFSFE